MKKLYTALLLISSFAFGQTHTHATLDANQTFTGVNTFNGNVLMSSTLQFTNAGIFSSENDYVSAQINNLTPAAWLALTNQFYTMTNAVSAVNQLPVGTTNQSGAAGFFAVNSLCNSLVRTKCAAVAVQGFSRAGADGAWAENNFSSGDGPGIANAQLTGVEIDMGVSGTPAFIRGITIPINPAFLGGLPGTMPANSVGIELGGYDDGGGHTLKWTAGITIDNGAVGTGGRGVEVGAVSASGTSVPSSTIAFDRFDSGSALHIDADMIHETSTGVLALNTTNPTLGVSVSGTAATWTSGAGAASGNCTVGSIYTNTSAGSASTVLYVCQPANTWTAVTVP